MLLATIASGCASARSRTESTAQPARSVSSISLPGASSDGVFMDYLAYDRAHKQVWVPAGNTASVDVVDAATDRVSRIEGFRTTEIERRGVRRTVGPSSATVGDRVVYVGNRGDSSVCAVDAGSLTVGACVALQSMPDGLAYVASAREVWVTLPRDNAIAVLDAAVPGALTRKTTIHLSGQPEGFAVDDARGLFYTNFEDQDRTLTIDVDSRQVTSNWPAGCGADGPRGLALDGDLDFLLVACPSRVTVLDVRHDGTPLMSLDVGDGIDNIDYVRPRHELYAAAARAATLTIAHLDANGRLTTLATVPTASGARNAVATDEGTAYVADSPEGKILVVALTKRP
jgi:DNA-binding beta-propeller fold protein YncE